MTSCMIAVSYREGIRGKVRSQGRDDDLPIVGMAGNRSLEIGGGQGAGGPAAGPEEREGALKAQAMAGNLNLQGSPARFLPTLECPDC